MKLLNKIKNTRGLNTFELVIISFIVIIAVTVFVDLTNIQRKHQAVSTTINYVARTIAPQGGLRQSKPPQYLNEYYNSQSLYNDVKKAMNSADIADGEWTLSIKTPTNGNVVISPYTNLDIVDIGKNMEVTLTINYKWKLASQLTPIKPTGSNTAKRVATSTFKVRTDGNGVTGVK